MRTKGPADQVCLSRRRPISPGPQCRHRSAPGWGPKAGAAWGRDSAVPSLPLRWTPGGSTAAVLVKGDPISPGRVVGNPPRGEGLPTEQAQGLRLRELVGADQLTLRLLVSLRVCTQAGRGWGGGRPGLGAQRPRPQDCPAALCEADGTQGAGGFLRALGTKTGGQRWAGGGPKSLCCDSQSLWAPPGWRKDERVGFRAISTRSHPGGGRGRRAGSYRAWQRQSLHAQNLTQPCKEETLMPTMARANLEDVLLSERGQRRRTNTPRPHSQGAQSSGIRRDGREGRGGGRGLGKGYVSWGRGSCARRGSSADGGGDGRTAKCNAAKCRLQPGSDGPFHAMCILLQVNFFLGLLRSLEG